MKLFKVYTTKDTVPPSSPFTPTATTVGDQLTVSATSDLAVGDFIADLAQNEVRKIVRKTGDTTFRLDSGFTLNLTAATVVRVPKNSAKSGIISIAADKGGDVTVNGQTLSSGSSVTFSVSDLERATGSRYVEPVIVDGSTNNATVVAEK